MLPCLLLGHGCSADAKLDSSPAEASTEAPGASTTMPAPRPLGDEPMQPASLSVAEDSLALRCEQTLGSFPASLDTGLALPLSIHVVRSTHATESLCAIVQEMNDIWWTQAGVCFDAEIVLHDEPVDTRLNLWFEGSSPFPNGTDANGVYVSPLEIYSLDHPNLADVTGPVRHPAARTAAHELGHALGLPHQNCGDACLELLMTSGTKGFRLISGSPADRDEIATARTTIATSQFARVALELEPDEPCMGALLPADPER